MARRRRDRHLATEYGLQQIHEGSGPARVAGVLLQVVQPQDGVRAVACTGSGALWRHDCSRCHVAPVSQLLQRAGTIPWAPARRAPAPSLLTPAHGAGTRARGRVGVVTLRQEVHAGRGVPGRAPLGGPAQSQQAGDILPGQPCVRETARQPSLRAVDVARQTHTGGAAHRAAAAQCWLSFTAGSTPGACCWMCTPSGACQAPGGPTR